jgi:hypothetical protein
MPPKGAKRKNEEPEAPEPKKAKTNAERQKKYVNKEEGSFEQAVAKCRTNFKKKKYAAKNAILAKKFGNKKPAPQAEKNAAVVEWENSAAFANKYSEEALETELATVRFQWERENNKKAPLLTSETYGWSAVEKKQGKKFNAQEKFDVQLSRLGMEIDEKLPEADEGKKVAKTINKKATNFFDKWEKLALEEDEKAEEEIELFVFSEEKKKKKPATEKTETSDESNKESDEDFEVVEEEEEEKEMEIDEKEIKAAKKRLGRK